MRGWEPVALLASLLVGCTWLFPFGSPGPGDAAAPGPDAGATDDGGLDAGVSCRPETLVYDEEPRPTAPVDPPPVGEWQTDADFGSRYVRVAEGARLTADPEASVFSVLSSWLALEHADGILTVFALDGDSAPSEHETLADCRPDDARWSNVDDGLLFCVEAPTSDLLTAIDVTGASLPVTSRLTEHATDFEGAIEDLTLSGGDELIAFDDGHTGFVVAQDLTLVQSWTDDPDLDRLVLDRSGRWALALSDGDSRPTLWDLDDNRRTVLLDMSIWAMGDGLIYWFEYDGQLRTAEIRTNDDVHTLHDRSEGEGVAIAVPGAGLGWVLVAYSDAGEEAVAYDNEIVAVSDDLDHPWAVRLLHHHHSDPSAMRLRVSRDGRYALFESDFGAGEPEAYLLELPAICPPN